MKKPIARIKELRDLRLGNKVASVAQPIAKAIDKTLGTSLAECSGCKKRAQWLNSLTEEALDNSPLYSIKKLWQKKP